MINISPNTPKPINNTTTTSTMSSENNPSTLGSYANSAAGAVQSGIASLTGNTSEKVN